MIIKRIKLKNFRNYTNTQVDFGPITVLVGKNGIGKTNIVEALGMLSYARSFRARDERNLIRKKEKFAQIEADLEDSTHINFVISNNGSTLKKEVNINGIKKGLSQIIGNFKVVLFTPESLKIVTGSPSERRKFLDIVASQVDKKYLENIIRYRHVLKQKNQLLKLIGEGKTKKDGLKFWNDELIKHAKYIMESRAKIVKYFDKYVRETYPQITSKQDDTFKLLYDPKINDIERIDDIVYLAQEREIAAQKTIYGPHLDEIRFTMNQKYLSEIGSRGEIRSVVFCLKLAELNYIESVEKTDKKTLLLLDDIFSELDKIRREKILHLIKDRQTIITTTEKELIHIDTHEIKFIEINKL